MELSKTKDTLIYRSDDYFSSFPAIANLGGGRMIAVFRRAPRYRGLPGLRPGWFTHLDRNSQLMMVTSEDGGETWGEPRLLFAPPVGGSQDGGLFFDGKLLLANSFIWGNLPDSVIEALRASGQDEFIYSYGGSNIATHIGSYVLRSYDLGVTWEGPFFPEPIPGAPESLPGYPLRMQHRANIIRASDGRLLFPGQSLRYRPERH